MWRCNNNIEGIFVKPISSFLLYTLRHSGVHYFVYILFLIYALAISNERSLHIAINETTGQPSPYSKRNSMAVVVQTAYSATNLPYSGVFKPCESFKQHTVQPTYHTRVYLQIMLTL